jgi:enoyl-CoA hydratase/carnithine racemase
LSCAEPGTPAPGRLELDEPAPGVARLRIANPAKRGALDRTILDAFVRELGRLEARCVVICGQPGIFSAGYDLAALAQEHGSARSETGQASTERTDTSAPQSSPADPLAAALQAIESYPYPTLAALTGHAVGGGLELALACDLRVAASSIKLSMPPAKLGVVYSHAGMRRFIQAIGAPRTRELFLLGQAIDAATAHAWGLVNELAAPEALETRALELARTLADNAPLSQRGNKRVIAALTDACAQLSPQAEQELARLRDEAFASEDFRQALSAVAARQTPRWRGR